MTAVSPPVLGQNREWKQTCVLLLPAMSSLYQAMGGQCTKFPIF